MKKLFLFSVIAGVLASCSSVEIAKRQHRSGYYVSFGNKTEVNKTETKENQSVAQHEVAETSIEAQEVEVVNNVDASEVVENNVVNNQKNELTPSKSSKQNLFTQNLNEEKVESKKSNFVQKLAKKSIVSKLSKPTNDIMLLILVILAIFLPPIAVGLKTNWSLIPLLISIILTLLFWLPGIIHALLVVFDII
jgi:uncharacterized membrane protein YqaE (UPF0057 family)